MKKNGKAPRISVSVQEKSYADLNDIAKKHDLSVSWLARHAIVDFIERYRTDSTNFNLPLSKKEG